MWEKILRERAQEEYQRRMHMVLLKQQEAFKVIPVVEKWKQQYGVALERYRFLVLDGPSRMGKTCFARCLGSSIEPSAVLELNCAGGGEVCLRDFVWGQHELIIFDEIVPEMVLQQRKVFQASKVAVELGRSATNCHMYTVHLHRVRMVLCSNRWKSCSASLTLEDADWLRANSFFLRVTAPLWESSAPVEPSACRQRAQLPG